MDDQKVLKKRLKVLMNRPENMVCADCPERQPRWASLIVPPPGAPAGSLAIGAFVCLECSGSHRRLGVHISFVRSINLDSWKEKEVLAMENGGNAKVNAIFESRLPDQNIKPHNHADGPTRERFIRDKYERRKYYDAKGFAEYAASASMQAPPKQKAPSARVGSDSGERGPPRRAESVGPPSDVARQRLEQRRERIKHSNSNVVERTSSGLGNAMIKAKQTPVAKAPASAPVDLLDFGDFGGGDTNQQTPQTDLFNMNDNVNTSTDVPPITNNVNRDAASAPNSGYGLDMFEFLTKDKDLVPEQTKKNSVDILSLYNSTSNGQQQTNFGNGMANSQNMYASMPPLTSYMAGMSLGHNNMQQQGSYPGSNPQMMMMQQQQNQMMYGQQKQNMMQQGGNNMMMQQGGNNMMMQQGGNNMMMQQGGNNMMMQQGGNNMMMQQGGNNMMMQQGGNNMMMQGGYNGTMMQGSSNPMQQQQQTFQMSGFGGTNFGAPMGVGPPVGSMMTGANQVAANKPKKSPEKEDPFAQFGMNVFRS